MVNIQNTKCEVILILTDCGDQQTQIAAAAEAAGRDHWRSELAWCCSTGARRLISRPLAALAGPLRPQTCLQTWLIKNTINKMNKNKLRIY